ncbi:MAG: hypothetical protein ACI9LM_001649 [Alteromonadaceae bacterium]|jgi:hypothetical protein
MTKKILTAKDAEKAADVTKKLIENESIEKDQVDSEDILKDTAGGTTGAALDRAAWKVSYET